MEEEKGLRLGQSNTRKLSESIHFCCFHTLKQIVTNSYVRTHEFTRTHAHTHAHTHTRTQNNKSQGNMGAGSGRDQPIVVTDDEKLTTRNSVSDVTKLQHRIREIAQVSAPVYFYFIDK